MDYFEAHATYITLGSDVIRLQDGANAISIAEEANRRQRGGDSEPDVIADIIKAYGLGCTRLTAFALAAGG